MIKLEASDRLKIYWNMFVFHGSIPTPHLSLSSERCTNALVRMVQLANETQLDTLASNDRSDLADSLPDYSRQLRIRVSPVVSR